MGPLLASIGVASAGGLPDVDAPWKTGARSPDESAVVVGVEDYAFVADVPYAARDAQAFHDFLVYTRGLPTSRVELLTSGASREKMLAAIDRAAAEGTGKLWIYFAGHGAASVASGERMWLGDDVRPDPEIFDSRAVTVQEVKTRAGAREVVIVADACYSGVGRGGQEIITGKRFAVPAYAASAGPKVLEWSAAGPNELSGPIEAVQHGAFTYFVLGALRGWADGERDGVRDGKVTAEEADLYVRSALRTAQVTTQRPVLAVSDREWVMATGKLEAAPDLALAVRPPAPAPAPAPVAAPAPAPVAAGPAMTGRTRRVLAYEVPDPGIEAMDRVQALLDRTKAPQGNDPQEALDAMGSPFDWDAEEAGDAWLAKGRDELAIAWYLEAIDRDVGSRQTALDKLIQMRAEVEIVAYHNRALAQHDAKEVVGYYVYALYGLGRRADAEALRAQVEPTNDVWPVYHVLVGGALGRFLKDEAGKCEALWRGFTMYTGYSNYVSEGCDPRRALPFVEAEALAKPGDAWTLNVLGDVRMALADKAGACEAWRRSYALDTTYAQYELDKCE